MVLVLVKRYKIEMEGAMDEKSLKKAQKKSGRFFMREYKKRKGLNREEPTGETKDFLERDFDAIK